MAKKIMACKAAPEIELCFDGGESILLRFDIRCLMNIQELEGGLGEFMKKNVAEMAAGIVYAAGKGINGDKDFTEEKARALISGMSLGDLLDIIKTFEESIGETKNDENAKKLMAQFLTQK